MADAPDPIATQLAEKIARLESEIAERVAERDRCRTALGALNTLDNHKHSLQSKAMVQTHRVQISGGRTDDALVKAANEVHHTMTSLAKAVGCSPSLLSQARHNNCSIGKALAAKIQELTRSEKLPKGFEANKRNWPQLRDE